MIIISKHLTNKTCHRDRIARLTAPCPSHKNFNIKLFANAAADANANANPGAGGSTIALPGLRPGELKRCSVFQDTNFAQRDYMLLGECLCY